MDRRRSNTLTSTGLDGEPVSAAVPAALPRANDAVPSVTSGTLSSSAAAGATLTVAPAATPGNPAKDDSGTGTGNAAPR